jgi:hypothetical protein
VREGGRKYVTDGHHQWLFDLSTDPFEYRNLATGDRRRCASYEDELIAWHRYQPRYLDRFRLQQR